jgi:hypothetical protein
MIKSVNSSGRYIQTGGGIPMSPYFSPGAQGAGQMRFNTNSNNIEVWDGVTWKEISNNYASVGLTSEAESLLDWAREKRDEDVQLKTLMESHPGLKDLKEKLDLMTQLVSKEQATQD